VTSGIVYPYAVLELAKRYRFRSIGGTSAGAIAAALAAAADYARSVRDDPSGFVRLQRHCDELPQILPTLFQPEPRYRRLFAMLMRAQGGAGALGLLLSVPGVAPLAASVGAVLAVFFCSCFTPGLPASCLERRWARSPASSPGWSGWSAATCRLATSASARGSISRAELGLH